MVNARAVFAPPMAGAGVLTAPECAVLASLLVATLVPWVKQYLGKVSDGSFGWGETDSVSPYIWQPTSFP